MVPYSTPIEVVADRYVIKGKHLGQLVGIVRPFIECLDDPGTVNAAF